MATNLSGLSALTTAASALSNLVLVTPQDVGYQPQSADGSTGDQPPTLLFHIEGEQSAEFESDITDHFVETNSAINDQWSLKPEIVNVEGFIGELNNVTPEALQALKTIADKFTVIDGYTPGLSASAINAYNEAFFLYQNAKSAVNSAVSAWSSLAGALTGSGGPANSTIGSGGLTIGENQNKQQIMFQQFYGYWRTRTLFTVQTPWAIFQNMAIKKVTAVQEAETKVITNFKVQFKMMRFAGTQSSAGADAILKGRLAAQAAGLTDLGTSTPIPSIGLSTGLGKMGV